MVDFTQIVQTLIDIGFYKVVLPFILVYAVVFAVLQKSKIFSYEDSGKEARHVKNINSVIAFVFAVFVVASIQTVQYIENIILNVVLILVFLLAVLIIFGMIFGEDYKKFFTNGGKLTGTGKVFAGILFLILVVIALALTGILNWIIEWWEDSQWNGELFSTILVLALIFGVLYWITKDPSDKSNNSEN